MEHSVGTMVTQRVIGIALGYEDLIDHDELRHDPVLAVLAGKLKAHRSDCAPLAGKSTLNRLELSRPEPTRYHKVSHNAAAIETLFVDLILGAHRRAPEQIILDRDATDDPLHGQQEGRFFHGDHDCYCYLPLYIFCGRQLLAAKLRRSNIDGAGGAVEEVARIVAQIRRRWPRVRILLRGDFSFARQTLMAWCEANRVDFLFGLARNERLEEVIKSELMTAALESLDRQAGAVLQGLHLVDIGQLEPSPSCCRQGRGDPRRGQSAICRHLAEASRGRCPVSLRDGRPRPRRDGEPHQGMPKLDLFADRTSTATMRANQLRLWLASMAYALLCAARRIGWHIRSSHRPPAHHPAQAAETRRLGARQRATDQTCSGLSLSLSERICPGACPAQKRGRSLTRTRQRTADRYPDNAINTLARLDLGRKCLPCHTVSPRSYIHRLAAGVHTAGAAWFEKSRLDTSFECRMQCIPTCRSLPV